MTIRVPKVPLTYPGTNETIWIDIYEQIVRERLLLVCGMIDKDLAAKITSLLLLLGEDDETILLYLHSRGGGALSGIAIYDAMKAVKPNVYTAVMGLALSVASLILSGGTYNKRLALRHAKIMIHQPVIAPISGHPKLLELEAEEMVQLRNTIADIYAKNTGKPVSVIQQDLERDKYMSPTEAQEYGIIDRIIKRKPHDETSE